MVSDTTGKGCNSNIELLRIISMCMIIISHYFAHNGIAYGTLPIGVNRFISEFMSFGTIGVALFMLISGYFLGVSEKKFRVSKLLMVLLQVFFYSSSIFLLSIVLHGEKITIYNLTHSFAPITFRTYWFVTVYVLIYAFHPFINKFLRTLTRSQYIHFIILSVFVFSFMKTITGQDFDAGRAGLFLTYYAIGNYLRAYNDNYFSKRKNRIIALLMSIAVIIMSIIILDLLGGVFGSHSSYLVSSGGTIFVLVIAICMFCALAYARQSENKLINLIASLTFGVYLIHDNYLVRNIIWTDMFHNADYINSPFMLLHMLGVVSLIFTACSIIEFVRKNTLERLYTATIMPRIDSFCRRAAKRVNSSV